MKTKVRTGKEVFIVKATITQNGNTEEKMFVRTGKAIGAANPTNEADFPMIPQNANLQVTIEVFFNGTATVDQELPTTDGDGLMDAWGSLYTPLED